MRAIAVAAVGLLAWGNSAGQGITQEKQQALWAFVASQDIAETWPEILRQTGKHAIDSIRDGAYRAIADEPRISEAERERRRKIAQSVIPAMAAEMQAAMEKVDAHAMLEDMVYSVYARYYEIDDLRALTAFYTSPVGRKLLQLTPTLQAESRRTGRPPQFGNYFSTSELGALLAFQQSNAAQKQSMVAAKAKVGLDEVYHRHVDPLLRPIIEKYRARLQQEFARGALP